MRPDGIVIEEPFSQPHAGLRKGSEERFVEQFIAQPAIKALNERILGGLSRGNIMPRDAGFLGPAQDRLWFTTKPSRRRKMSRRR